MDLFEHYSQENARHDQPLAERMRPESLKDIMGQENIIGPGSVLRGAVENDRIFSMIFWGPPGCGKTTLARIIAKETQSYFIHFSAVLSGVKEIRAVIEDAKKQRLIHRRKTLLFVDEIHRFNKSQQDSFLHQVESGLITLIGATTENPSFEIIAPLLSRCRVFTLNSLSGEALAAILKRALNNQNSGLGPLKLDADEKALYHLAGASDGDARFALNSLETAAQLVSAGGRQLITLKDAEQAVEKKSLLYDKSGEEHYNLISAFHKSLRGSDPDAALYWLARMLESGEDPLYAARRMVRFASEDIGNADPYALRVALDAVESYRFLGSPEGDLALSQAAVYLATALKSNAVYTAHKHVRSVIKQTGTLPVPFHIRNAPTRLMKEMGYGKGYKYAHDFSDGYVGQEYFPDDLKERQFYFPTDRGYEQAVKERLEHWRNKK